MKVPNFVGSWATSTALEVDTEDLLNMQPEAQESPGAKSDLVYYGSPGTRWVLNEGDGPIRGAVTLGLITYYVNDDTVYSFSNGGNTPLTGTVSNSSDNPVRMAGNATDIMVVSDGIAYWNDGGTITTVSDPPWTSAIDVVFLDGFFIVLDDDGSAAGGQFFISPDPSTWDALDFSTSPASANKLVALAVDHGELWVFGTEVTQVFFNNGNADFPFVPNPSGVIMQGILTRDSLQQLDNTLFWMGRNKDGYSQAFMAEGYSPRVISTRPLERYWQSLTGADTFIRSWAYQMDGHTVWHLNFLDLDTSFRFDRSTNLWHRVGYRNPTTGLDEAHIGSCHFIFNGSLHYIGDRRNGTIWKLDPDIYVDEFQAGTDFQGDPDYPGVPLVSRRRAAVVFSENKWIFCKLFELITTPGIGNGTLWTPESNPPWMFRWSKDNGHNWSNEYLLRAGPQGAFSTRLRKVGLGMARAYVFEVSFSANLPRCIIGAEMEIEIGTS